MALDCKETLELGVNACAAGDWKSGLVHLRQLKRQEGACGGFPGIFYSYLGLAMARCEGRMHEGLEWCSHAVAIEPEEPVNYLNLTKTYLLLNNRHGAIHTLREGLGVDSEHEGLRELHRTLGVRRRLPIWFLARGHQLNLFLGRMKARSDARRTTVGTAPRVGDETTGIFRPAE
ncbi:MAG: tetratricopeptide repeat protein [Thermoanaerobaculia bacterium]